MKYALRHLYSALVRIGIDPRRGLCYLSGLPRYYRDRKRFRALSDQSPHPFKLGRSYPCLSDRTASSGSGRGHYFHQDLWAARKIFNRCPNHHIDIGSRIDGFVAHVACFRALEVIDTRPLNATIPNVSFIQADFTQPLPDELTGQYDSASCLHALEHFGLGRYGDPIDYEGYRNGFLNLYNLLQPDGILYFSVPIGPERVEFNAHRVFALSTLLEMFHNRFEVLSFACVDDRGEMHDPAPLTDQTIQNHCGCQFGCGIFELKKLTP